MRFCNIEITAIWLVENVFQLLWDLFLQWMGLFKLDFVLFIFVLFDIRSSKFCLGQSGSPWNIVHQRSLWKWIVFWSSVCQFYVEVICHKGTIIHGIFYSWMTRTRDDWQSIRLCLYFKSFPFNIVWQELTLSTSQNIYLGMCVLMMSFTVAGNFFFLRLDVHLFSKYVKAAFMWTWLW